MTDEKEPKNQTIESASATENEEIIELTDEITPVPENDDEIIELTNEVAPTGSISPEADEEIDAAPEKDTIAADIMSAESDQTALAPETAEALLDGDIKISTEIEDELSFDEQSHDDFVNSLGMDLETDSAMSELPEESDTLAEPETDQIAEFNTDVISPEQIEAAIERVIIKVLPEKIESILAEAIERTLTKEIDKLKSLLLENSAGDNE